MDRTLEHSDAVELLPWLANGTLESAEREAVHEHASSCVICRQELADLERLVARMGEEASELPLPAPDMRRINARIDAEIEREKHRPLLRIARVARSCHAWVRNPWRFAFAVQTAVVLGVALVLWRGEPEPGYTTLTTPESLPSGNYLRVVFEPGMAARDIDVLLAAHGLVRIDGPSERGVFTLGFASANDATGRKEILTHLEGEAGVLFVQPVAGTGE